MLDLRGRDTLLPLGWLEDQAPQLTLLSMCRACPTFKPRAFQEKADSPPAELLSDLGLLVRRDSRRLLFS